MGDFDKIDQKEDILYLQMPESENMHVPLGEFKQFHKTRIWAALMVGGVGGISLHTHVGAKCYTK